MIAKEPDLTILIDMDPSESLRRALERDTEDSRFEEFGAALQEQMRDGFLRLAHEYKNRFSVIDGNRDIKSIFKSVCDVVDAKLQD
jgi:dTMP kinase